MNPVTVEAFLDELQKIFMIESEETKVCRVLTRARHDIRPIFERLQDDGKLRGFKIGMPEVTVFTGRQEDRRD